MTDPSGTRTDHVAPVGAPLPLETLTECALVAARRLARLHRGSTQPVPVPAANRMAPELTGRTSHVVDERADLYALGATMYEWATGRAPFEERDPLKLVREQLTRTPPAPIELRPELPRPLSDMILRLLEKEPDRRYHAADGLVHDLKRMKRAAKEGVFAHFSLGERDFPTRLVARGLAGREQEIEHLRAAVDAASAGGRRVVLVSGSAGVGKTALLGELKSIVAACNGRLVAQRFDSFSRDESSAVFGALGSLGRLLLTEPESELAALRSRILSEVGPQAGLACDVPEFRLLLGDLPRPSTDDPAQSVAALEHMFLDLFGAIAAPGRPLALVLDDVQWSSGFCERLVENVLGRPALRGLVVVCAFRPNDQPSPLSRIVASESSAASVLSELSIANLGDADVARMLADMLRLPHARALPLAKALQPYSGGNPHDTVELLNALRRDGLLVPRSRDWRWDPRDLRRYIGRGEVMDFLDTRVARLPAGARELLQVLACLRHEVSPMLARAASAADASEFEANLAILLEQGLVVKSPGPVTSLRVLNDRVQQAGYATLTDPARLELHLTLARRLAANKFFHSAAADQYVAASDVVLQPAECRSAAALLQSTASLNRATANLPAAQSMLEAAVSLLVRAAEAGEPDPELSHACDVDLHLTLYGRGRVNEADAVYRRIIRRDDDPLRIVDAACVQVRSLCNRGEASEAAALALAFLDRLGLVVPGRLTDHDIEGGRADLRVWVDQFDVERELARPDAQDPFVIAAAKMLGRLTAPAYLMDDPQLACWLVTESRVLWERHGPCAPLVSPLSRVNLVSSEPDPAVGYRLGRFLLSICEARGWEPERCQALDLLAANSTHWFEPIEHSLDQARWAQKGFLAGGDLQNACLTYRVSAVATFETASSLSAFEREVNTGFEMARRVGNRQAQAYYAPELQLLRALRGSTAAPGSFEGDGFSEAGYLVEAASMPRAILAYHLRRMVSCAIFGDGEGLAAHVRISMGMLNFHSYYAASWAFWLGGLAAALRLQRAAFAGDAIDPATSCELDRCVEWVGRAAEHSPSNFRHMHSHLKAERAWAMGDTMASTQWFDHALLVVDDASRPWHRALITERAGRFQIAHGRMRAGRQLLARACQLYEAWGATSKAAHLGETVGLRRGSAAASPGSVQSTVADELDTLAVLRASQALSSERVPAKLKSKVEEVLGSVTGATQVVLALWDDDLSDWVLRAGEEAQGDGSHSLAADASRIPLSALRYAERTREPLLLPDALADDRFSRDPYFQGLERCSLMVVPILHQGKMRAMLVLENRASRGAFSTARLDAVMMIAGQLAVSLESAQLYERLERKVREQTRQLREAQSRLVDEARRAGMAQIATNVLHNVGNVLTSVNVSTHVLATQVRGSRAARVADLAQLLEENSTDLARFSEADERGRMLPGYLRELASALAAEREEQLAELGRLGSSVDHIKNVVAMQQSYAGASGVLKTCSIVELVEDALRIQQDALDRHEIKVIREYAEVHVVAIDKTRVMQILVNLIENARQAMYDVEGERRLFVSVKDESGTLQISVRDTGCGIGRENLARIFSHGFTTKVGGHGFGLHSCAVAAKEMGGTLTVQSSGPGAGAAFTLILPLDITAG